MRRALRCRFQEDTKWMVVTQRRWTAAPGGGDKNDRSGTSACRNGSCSSVSTELLGGFGQ
jgi:hypothetical protein